MPSESRRIARLHPLRVRAIGFAAGRTLIARANWDIVEVRDLEGTLHMRHQVALEGELLMHAFAFVAGRYLVVELGGGVMAAGYRAWDFDERRWCAGALDHWDDVSLVGVDEARGRVALSDGSGVDVIDVPGDRVSTRLALASPTTVAFHPARPDVVAASGDRFLLGEEETDEDTIAVFTGQRLEHARRTPRYPTSNGPSLAWVDDHVLLLATGGGEVVSWSRELTLARVLLTVSASPRSVRASHGRWVIVHAGDEAVVLDTRGGRTRSVRGLAYVEPSGTTLAWATDDDAGRERLE